jgi:hypothetical protein
MGNAARDAVQRKSVGDLTLDRILFPSEAWAKQNPTLRLWVILKYGAKKSSLALLGLLLGTAPALSAMESKPPVIGNPVCSENHPGSSRRIPDYIRLSLRFL